MKPDDVKRVGVIGCGIMGSGIVEVCAKAGNQVVFVEIDDEQVERGRARIEKSLARAVERGKLSEEERVGVMGAIHGTADYEDIADSDLIIEAATEHLDTKLEIFRVLDGITRDDIVLATNTSSLPIVQMATQTKRPDKVVGMHFFIVNYLLTYYLNSAIRMLEEEFATKEDIDTAVKLGLGHPMGPFELLDLIGLDTMMAVAEVLYDEFRDPDVAPPPMARRMVHAGFLGRKTGKGFYEYGEK
jgi:3-hydroxybutyryl-CoA dehydrogenase